MTMQSGARSIPPADPEARRLGRNCAPVWANRKRSAWTNVLAVPLILAPFWLAPFCNDTAHADPPALRTTAQQLSQSADGDPAEESDDGPAHIHLEFDVSYGSATARFVQPADVVPLLCELPEGCPNYDITTDVMRGAAGIAFGGFTLEGTVEIPTDSQAALRYKAWTAGIRVDTSEGGWLGIQVRFAYVQRFAELDGHGGRGSVGLTLRPLEWISVFGELAGEITSVPAGLSEGSVLFSYGYFSGFGARFHFGL